MSATGLNPTERAQQLRVPKERLAEYDKLMAQGGITAVIQALEDEHEHRAKT